MSYKILINDEYKYDAESIGKQEIILNISDDSEQIFKTELISREGLSVDIVNPITDSLLKSRNILFEENLHCVDKVAVGQRECFLLQLFVVRIDINRYF